MAGIPGRFGQIPANSCLSPVNIVNYLLIYIKYLYIFGYSNVKTSTMAEVKASTRLGKGKWYNYYKFPLLPRLEIRKANEYNTAGFSFNWLFFTVWSLDSFSFEASVVCSGHWGLGVIGILPYLRWAVTVPMPYKLEEWVNNNLDRKPKQVYYEDTEQEWL